MTPFDVLATVAVLAGIVRAVIDGFRRQFPRLDGFGVQAAAVAVGVGLAWGLDLQATEALLTAAGAVGARPVVAVVDYIITGAAIASGAGVVADLTKTRKVLVEVDDAGRPR